MDHYAQDSTRRVLRAGAGEPLVLLHGVTGSAAMWRDVVPLLAPDYDVIAPTALGHAGGPPLQRRPARFADIVDDAERFLDELGIDRAHLAGNSMGGWSALELCRRGRALSVCALSPAGAWSDAEREAAVGLLRGTVAETRATRFALPLVSWLPAVRRYALRGICADGGAVPRQQLLALADDLLGCQAVDELLQSQERLSALQPSCPTTVAWCGQDKVFPVDVFAPRARELIGGARFIVLEGLGHVPMLDSPERVAHTIRQAATPAADDGGR